MKPFYQEAGTTGASDWPKFPRGMQGAPEAGPDNPVWDKVVPVPTDPNGDLELDLTALDALKDSPNPAATWVLQAFEKILDSARW